jgi:hypothetical protein
MNRLPLAMAWCLIVMVSDVMAQQTPIVLPADGSAIVITMDSRGGFPQPGPPRKNMNPSLTVRADGRVTVLVDGQGIVPDIERNLPADKVQELLRFIVTDQQFFASDLTSEEIWRAIRAEDARRGRGSRWADVPDTVIRIKTADAEKEIIFNGVGAYARTYPTVAALGRLLAVETRLRRLYEEVRSGTR